MILLSQNYNEQLKSNLMMLCYNITNNDDIDYKLHLIQDEKYFFFLILCVNLDKHI